MMLEINKDTLIALPIGRLKVEGRVRPERISFGKLNNGREAIEIAPAVRIMRHGSITLKSAVESVRTYEGTDEVHALIRGQALTSIPAFC